MIKERETVYLIDGSSYIYRAYHAVSHLSNSRGFPTNAVLGFTKMLLKFINEIPPGYLAVALDVKGPTFRHEIYKDYKSNRPPMPDDLVVQLPYIRAVIQGLNIRILEKNGYEADDIIGTLARIGEEKGYDVVMVTGDKDFRQILSPHISMWDTMKDRVTDYESFKQEYGIEPDQVIDMMGLSGDSSDNIPGVRGIGEKTALALIREYGSLENVYEHIQDIKKKKQKENLEKGYDNAVLSKRLVTIDRHAPVSDTIDDLKVGDPDTEILSRIFHELEFRGLWDQFSSRKDKVKKDYRLCVTGQEMTDLKDKIKNSEIISIDTETTGINPMIAELVGVSISTEDNRAYYLPMGHSYLGAPEQLSPQDALEILRPVLEKEEIKKTGQNIKYDAIVLGRYGVELKGIYFDTMIASYVINPGLRQHNLDYLAQHYLNHRMIKYQDVVGKGRAAVSFAEVDIDHAKEYSCEDADITFQLMNRLDSQLKKDRNQGLFHDLEMKLMPVLMTMELAGIKIDADFFTGMSRDFAGEIREIQKQVFEEAGMEFNINSPQQLGFVLFEKLGLPAQKKTAKNKNHSTDVGVLKKLAAMNFRIPELLLRFRTLTKLKSTYLDALVKMVNPVTGRIHTSFNQTVTATGRLSSSNPNLQNIPIRGEEGRKIRKGFVSDKGHLLVAADYSQVELRVFAHVSGDTGFIEAFNNEQDIHTRTASEILNVPVDQVDSDMRAIAKAINFGIIYGMGARKLSIELGIDNKTAREYIESYYKRYEGVLEYKEEIVRFARENGYVTTLFNRKRYLPEINSNRAGVRSEAERMAVNTPVQGTAADLIKKAMINIHERLNREGFRAKMLLQVHDELVFEVPEEELDRIIPVIKQEMEGVYDLDVPLKVDISHGRNWGEAH